MNTSLLPDVVHNFMLSFTRYISIRQNYLNISPTGIVIQPVMNIVIQTTRQLGHERRSGRNAVWIEVLLLLLLGRQFGPLQRQIRPDSADLQHSFRGLFRCAETPWPLLVHLRPWGDAVYRQIEELTGPYYTKETIDAVKDGDHHFIFIFGGRFVFRMCARVDYAIHVEVEVVEFHPVGVWFWGVGWYSDAIDIDGLKRKYKF